MDKHESVYAELSDMVDNFYLRGRQIRSMENKPRHYGSDMLLYPNEVYTLKAIAQEEGINQTDLSLKMFRTKGATSIVVQKLKKKGLIVQQESQIDQRVFQLFTTEKGREIYTKHLEYDMKYVQSLTTLLDVTLEELAQANRVMRLINQRFTKRYQEEGEGAFWEDSTVQAENDRHRKHSKPDAE